MKDKIKDLIYILLFAVVFFACGYFTARQTVRHQETTIVGKTITFMLPGRTDTIPKPVTEIHTMIDSSGKEYWKGKFDSLSQSIAKNDSTPSGDSTFAEYFLPYQISVEDSMTINYVTIFPLEPYERRARIDSTRYIPQVFEFTYLDTTVNVIRKNNLQTYATVSGCAVIGALIGNIPGAGIGAGIGLLVDELF